MPVEKIYMVRAIKAVGTQARDGKWGVEV